MSDVKQLHLLFALGDLVATPGALEALKDNRAKLLGLVARHGTGDFGCVCEEDKEHNRESIVHGNRILSAYAIDPTKPCEGHGDNCIWVITEADRSSTTVLLPSEY